MPQKLVIDLENGTEEYVELEGEELAEYEARQAEAPEATEPPKSLSELVSEVAHEIPDNAKPKDVLAKLAEKLEGK